MPFAFGKAVAPPNTRPNISSAESTQNGLVDHRHSVPLDARNEQDNEDALALASEDPLSLARCLRPFLCHMSINIDRQRERSNGCNHDASWGPSLPGLKVARMPDSAHPRRSED